MAKVTYSVLTFSNIVYLVALNMTDVSVCVSGICPNDSFPLDLQGDWYSIDRGMELHTSIQPDRLTNEIIERAECSDIANIEYNWQGHYVLLFNE